MRGRRTNGHSTRDLPGHLTLFKSKAIRGDLLRETWLVNDLLMHRPENWDQKHILINLVGCYISKSAGGFSSGRPALRYGFHMFSLLRLDIVGGFDTTSRTRSVSADRLRRLVHS